MSTPLRTERVRPVRAERAASRRRRRSVLLTIGVPLALAALVFGVWWVTSGGGLLSRKAHDPLVADQQLTVLAYRGEQTGIAVLATSDSNARDPVILVVPSNLYVSVPGHGTGPIGESLADGAMVAETTVANLLGLPFAHRGLLTSESVAALGEASGGLTVDLGTQVTLGPRTVGPGPVKLSGAELAAYLDGAKDPIEVKLRFEEVLPALLTAAKEHPAAFESAGTGADQGFAAAVGRVPADTPIDDLPALDDGSALVAGQAEALIKHLFVKPTDQLVSVVLLNGNGVPGIGGLVAQRIVPAGFRVVVSTNARTFDFPQTQIVVRDPKLMDLGRRLQSLLGVGQVSVGQASTGLSDITVIIGQDFTGA